MTDSEYYKLVHKSKRSSWSAWAEFHNRVAQYDFYYKGKKVCKWEAYNSGYTDYSRILRDLTPVRAIKVRGIDGKPLSIIDWKNIHHETVGS